MLDLKMIREQPEMVRAALARRHIDPPIDEILRLDERRRELVAEADQLRAERNTVSKQIARMKDAEERQRQIEAMRLVGDRVAELESLVSQVERERQTLLLELPNLPQPDVPDGADEHENVVIRHHGEPRQFDFPVRPHWEVGPELGLINFDWGVKLAGSRFYVLAGAGARLQRALIQWMLNLHVDEHGREELYVPFVVKEEALWAAGQLPKFRDNLYHDVEDDIWLAPTAEVPVTNIFRDEILDPTALPRRYVAYTPCFRREKMSAGRDVRGIKRGHQFDKVEMYTFCRPEDSPAELELILESAETVLRRLDLAYRVVKLCTGDLGNAAQVTYDLEVWSPGVGEWLEVSSCSNVGDYQARRGNIRFRREEGGRPEFCHTLNGSGLALPRVMIAVMENYQQPDGSIRAPEAIQPYLGQEVITAARQTSPSA